jgi:Na+/H+-dicarboxylate symporter
MHSLAARWSKLTLTTRILIGLALGVLLGVLMGDETRRLQGAANAFIGVMQMTVLPYLVVALIVGLGRLTRKEAGLLARYGGLTLLAIWALAVLVIAVMPVVFPRYQSAFFFSTTLLQPKEPLSFFELYIPANPFHSLANSLVPAVTLFSSAVGIGLIGIEDKERLLAPLDTMLSALGRVTHFIVELTPFGVVPIAAVAAGTLSGHDFSRLEVYFVAFVVAALVLGAVLLPLLVACLTPFRYREVLGASRDALVTAFVTSSAFIVMPMLIEECHRLAEKHRYDADGVRGVPETTVPIAFNFPTAGKLLTLLFVPFAAWLAGQPLELSAYPRLFVSGLFSYFAKAQVALPFLMDLVEVPHDLFQLYIPTTLLNGKFDSAVGAMSLFAFALITMSAIAGRLTVSVGALVRFAGPAVVTILASLGITWALLGTTVDTKYTKADVLAGMHLSRSPPPMAVYSGAPPPDAYSTLDLRPLARIKARRTLRVGYQKARLPFSFVNARGDLVGFDVEMASQLARDLEVRLEFVPVTPASLDEQLRNGEVDLVPSVPYTRHWLGRVRLSKPYMEGTLGLLVRDDRRDEFETPEALAEHERLAIGVPGERDLYADFVREILGDTPYTIVELGSWETMFDRHDEVDAVVALAEVAMAWSLVHPQYTVVIPRQPLMRRPLAYAMAPEGSDFATYVDEWVVLQQARGNVDKAYNYWILGRGSEEQEPRWSLLRNVFGWGRRESEPH